MDNVESMQEQVGNVNREIKKKGSKEMLEIEKQCNRNE